jgi:dihydrofolate reductase
MNIKKTMKASIFVATSIDGFIAREEGAIDWLSSTGNAKSGEDYGYRDFLNSVDAIVMGRNTFKQVLSFASWPYGKKPVIVLSNRKLKIPENLSKTVSSMNESPQEVVKQLGKLGFKHLYIDGGKTIQGFLKEGLIQQLIITMVPILIGTGIPLFGSLSHDVKLDHIETSQFDDGLVQCRYKVIGNNK